MTINASCRKINGNTLKLIACIIMLIDHLTAGIMIPVVREGLYQGSLSTEELNLIYKILRGIGRSAGVGLYLYRKQKKICGKSSLLWYHIRDLLRPYLQNKNRQIQFKYSVGP